jgi:hypothetical protein
MHKSFVDAERDEDKNSLFSISAQQLDGAKRAD